MSAQSITGAATFNVVNPLFVSVADVYSQYYGWIDALIAFAIFFSLAHVVFSKRFSRDGNKSREGTMVALGIGAALTFGFVMFQRSSNFRFGGELMQGFAGIIFLAVLNLLLYLILADFLRDERKKCAFAGSYFVVHSIFLSAFSPIYQQIFRVAPLVTGVLAVAYLLAIIQVFVCIFGMFGGGSNTNAAANEQWEPGAIGSGNNGGSGSNSAGAGGNSTPGSGPGMKAGDNGPLSVHIIQPQNGINAPLGSRARFIAEVRGGQKPIVWQLTPPDIARPSQGTIGAFSNGFSVDTVLARPGKFTATVNVTDRNGQRATATTTYTVLSGGVVQGTVVDKEKKPLGSVVVKITDLNSETELRSVDNIPLQQKTKDDGSFNFEGVPFNTPIVIRAASGDHVGQVAVPRTGALPNPFVLTFDHLPEIRGCLVVFPEYEYKKPKIFISEVNGVGRSEKQKDIAIALRNAAPKLLVLIEVKPGNGFSTTAEGDINKVEVYARFTETKSQIVTALKVESKTLDASSSKDKWIVRCLVGDPEGRPLKPGTGEIYAEVKDERQTEVKDRALVQVLKGGSSGNGEDGPFRAEITTVNGTPHNPLTGTYQLDDVSGIILEAEAKNPPFPLRTFWQIEWKKWSIDYENKQAKKLLGELDSLEQKILAMEREMKDASITPERRSEINEKLPKARDERDTIKKSLRQYYVKAIPQQRIPLQSRQYTDEQKVSERVLVGPGTFKLQADEQSTIDAIVIFYAYDENDQTNAQQALAEFRVSFTARPLIQEENELAPRKIHAIAYRKGQDENRPFSKITFDLVLARDGQFEYKDYATATPIFLTTDKQSLARAVVVNTFEAYINDIPPGHYMLRAFAESDGARLGGVVPIIIDKYSKGKKATVRMEVLAEY